jgi:DNA-binding NarL/FixJ family response regulator
MGNDVSNVARALVVALTAASCSSSATPQAHGANGKYHHHHIHQHDREVVTVSAGWKRCDQRGRRRASIEQRAHLLHPTKRPAPVASPRGEEPMPRRLTPAQLEILGLNSLGVRDAEIAARTGRSLSTVRTLAKSAERRLGVHSRTEAIRHAAVRGELRIWLRGKGGAWESAISRGGRDSPRDSRPSEEDK